MTPAAFDAVIVGGGPAGAATAILLARAGWAVALVEQQRYPRRKVCGECIGATNLPLLDALGVGAAVGSHAGPDLRRVALMHGAHTLVADLPRAADPAHPWGRALGRATLDRLLLEAAAAAGVTVLQPWTVRSITPAGPQPVCTLVSADPAATRAVTAPVVVLAHGSWHPLPQERGGQTAPFDPAASGRPSGARRGSAPAALLAFKANFVDADLAAGLLPVLAFAGGYGGMVVADGGVTTVAGCIRADRLRALRRAAPGHGAGEVFEAMLRTACAGVADALRAARRIGPWIASGPLQPGVRLRAGQLHWRVGNAAGEAHPIIGEGLSMALQSARLLATHLLAARDRRPQAAAHSAYVRAWRRHFEGRLRLAAVVAHLAMRPALLRPLLPLLQTRTGALTRLARWSDKVTYLEDGQ